MTLLYLLLILLLLPPIKSQRHLQDSHIDSLGLCHDVILNSTSSHLNRGNYDEKVSSAYGLVFVLQNTKVEFNTGDEEDEFTVDVTALSIYLDGTTGVNYTVYVIDGEYLTEDEGERFSLIGGVLGGENVDIGGEEFVDDVGWTRHGRGYIDEDRMNLEGMAVIKLDIPIVMEARSLKSVYIKLDAVDLCVLEEGDDGGALVPEGVDENVESEGYEYLKIHVGRAILLDNWAGNLQEEIFNEFYPPHRFIGNIYTNVPSCTKTVRNSYFDLYHMQSRLRADFDYSYRMMKQPLLFNQHNDQPTFPNMFNRRLQTNSTSGCIADTYTVYAVIEGELRKFALKKYSEKLPADGSVEVSDITFRVKADKAIWTGSCDDIRFIIDQKIVYNTQDADILTLGEIAELPFLGASDRDEALQMLKIDVFFVPFGRMDGPHVTDTNLNTRMPSSKPSVAPSVTMMPSMEPSDIRSDVPSEVPSFSPSDLPSTIPSIYPSFHPSSTPSDAPLFPTELPSTSPSETPTEMEITTLTTKVEFEYDIWYPPDRLTVEEIRGFVIGNVTNSFRNVLFKELPLLTFVNNFGLDLSSTQQHSVEIDSGATDVFCATDDLPENQNNRCERFALTLPFDHYSTLTKEKARFWVLRVSDRTSGNLKSSFSGFKSVKSDQRIVFEDATSEPTPEEEVVICDALTESLNSTLSAENYTVTAVNCTDFEFISNVRKKKKNMRIFNAVRSFHSFRRYLQSSAEGEVGGNLNVYYNIEAEYPIRAGELDLKADVFDDIIEDSINRGSVVEEMKHSLEEREIAVIENAVAEAEAVETPAPTPYPTFETVFIERPTDFGNPGTVETVSVSSNMGTVLAVVFSLVILASTCGMYLYYMRYVRFTPKDDFSDYFDDAYEASLLSGDVVGESFRRENSKDGSKSITLSAFEDRTHGDEPYNQQVRRKDSFDIDEVSVEDDLYSTSTTNSTSKSPMKEGRNNIIDLQSMRRLHAFESRAKLQDSALSSIDHQKEPSNNKMNESQRRIKSILDAFDDKIQNSQGQNDADDFESKLQSKLSREGTGKNQRNKSLHSSMESMDSYDERLKSKLSGGAGRNENDLQKSTASIDSFDQRLKSKLSGGIGRTEKDLHRSTESMDSFDERLRSKLQKDAGEGHKDLNRSMDSIDSFDERLRRKISSDGAGKTPKDGALHRSMESIDSFDDRIRAKLAREENKSSSEIPSDISFVKDTMKSSGSVSSVDSFDERIKKKLSKNAKTTSVSSLDSYEDRIQQKLAQTESQKPGVKRSNTMEDRIQQKMAQNSASSAPVLSAPSFTSLDSFEDRIQKKLDQAGVTSSTNNMARKPGIDKLSSASSMEDRIRQKMAQNNANASSTPVLNSASVSSLDSFEDRIQKKLDQAGVTSSTDSTAPKQGVDRLSSARTMEDRIQQKIAQNSISSTRQQRQNEIGDSPSFDQLPRNPGVQKMASTDLFEAAIQRKLSNDDTVSSRHLRSSSNVSVSSVESLDERIQQKIARDSAPKAAVQKPGVQKVPPSKNIFLSSSVSSFDSYEDRIKQKIAGNSSSQTPAVQRVASTKNTLEDRIQMKIAHDGSPSSRRLRSSTNVDKVDSLDKRVQQKSLSQRIVSTTASSKDSETLPRHLNSSTSVSSMDSYEDRIKKKLAENNATDALAGVGSQKPGVQRMSSASAFEDRIQQKLSQQNAGTPSRNLPSSASVSSMDSYEDRIKQKLAENNAAGASATSAVSQKPGVQKMSSTSTFDRIQQKLSQQNDGTPSRNLVPSASVSSMDSYEDRIKKKLAENNAAGAAATSAVSQKPGVQKMSSTSTFDRIQQKLSQQNVGTPSRNLPSSASVSSMDSYEDRIKKKLAENNAAGASLTSVVSQKPGVQQIAPTTTYEDRILSKTSEHGATSSRNLNSSATVSTVDSYEDRIKQKLAQNHARGDHRFNAQSQTPTTTFDRIQQKLSTTSFSTRAKQPEVRRMLSEDSFEGRIQQKISSGNNVHRRTSVDTMDALEEAPSRFTSTSSIETSDDQIQIKLSREKASSSSTAAQGNLAQSMISEESFKGHIQQNVLTKFQRKASTDTMDALEANKNNNTNKLRFQQKLDLSNSSRGSFLSIESDYLSQSSKKSRSHSPESMTSFKKNLTRRLAEAKLSEKEPPDKSITSVELPMDDNLTLDEKIMKKVKTKSSSSGDRRRKRRHKPKKLQTELD